MTRPTDLDRLRVKGPCDRTWESLTPVPGNASARFCDDCQKHVHDLSAMDGDEARRLLATARGRVCMLLTTRRDGTVVTREAPAVAARTGWASAAAAALVVGSAGLAGCSGDDRQAPSEPATAAPIGNDAGMEPATTLEGEREWQEGDELTPEMVEQLRALGYVDYE